MKLTFCGDDCDSCPRYIATYESDTKKLEELAVLWNKFGWRDHIVSADEIKCYGCSSVQPCQKGIKECAIEQKVNHCGECVDYPCEMIQKALDNTESYKEVCKSNCSKEIYEQLYKAFFMKKEYLDNIYGDEE